MIIINILLKILECSNLSSNFQINSKVMKILSSYALFLLCTAPVTFFLGDIDGNNIVIIN